MRKMTLLEMVQNIASALDTDEINSISDTIESIQIAEVIKETFYEQFNDIYIPEFQKLSRLEDINDLTRPNVLKIPSNMSKVEWIKYKDFRNADRFTDVEYVDPETFLELQLNYTSTGANVISVTDFGGFSYYIPNNTRPRYYTMFDDENIVFSGYDAESEATLQSSNTLVYGSFTTDFPLEDDFVPPIDGNLFPLLLAESKSVCFINLKQISSSKEEQRARRQRIRMQNDQFKNRKAQRSYFERGPNFARNR